MGFAIAILLFVVMILMILVYIASTICGALCCKCCNGAYKPRKFTKKDLVINKVVILVFVALTAAGCFLIFSEGPALLDGVSDLTQAMVDTVLDLVDDGRAISGAINSAAEDDSMALGDSPTPWLRWTTRWTRLRTPSTRRRTRSRSSSTPPAL